ncbi:MAG: hypothetical protein ACPGJV_06505 [Bacteriovoracaceae bacterium]
MDRNQDNPEHSPILFEHSLQAFFFDQLHELNQKSVTPIPGEMVYYSSLVMDKYGASANYFEEDDEGRVKEKLLGMKLLESGRFKGKKKKNELKEIGDTALILCGYFSDSIGRKFVDTSYYTSVGKTAYSHLDSLVPEAYDIPQFFSKVSKSFESMMSLMGIVSSHFQNQFEEGTILLVGNSKS